MKHKSELRCPHCRSIRLIKRGFCYYKRKKLQRYECRNCGKLTIVPIKVKRG